MWKFLQGRLLFVRVILLCSVAALVVIGIAVIYSVGHPAQFNPAGGVNELANLWKKQILFAGFGCIGFLAVNAINYRRFGAASYWIYGAVLVLLGLLLVGKVVDLPFVPVINGARRWIRIGSSGRSVQLQPSELCKLAYVLAMAWFLRYRSNYRNFTALTGPFVLTVLAMVLIILEPDLGTVLLMMPILLTMLFIAGAKVKHLLIMAALALLVSPALWYQMRPYQRTRISSVVLQSQWVQEKAEQHPALGNILMGEKFSRKKWENNWGYHLIRSKYAAASGGATGYGFREGPFIKYNFLPERHNDFIFAVIAHQWGFFGCLAVLALYAVVVWCGLEIAGSNPEPFGRLLAVGITATITFETIVNVSMTLGLMPITGLTLPLVSYGGSSLVINMISVGLLNNIGRCRPFSVARKRVE
jgi:cell division protein FtsW (lipid II flippase)